ncbi:MAG: DEAD/DEAH box helicase family protein [Woeseiaceae bacterium]|nr:DEAD/DEAH box helicase family protein [Woeseiaceae bacterium]
MVIIFDECHRSQFGDNHQAIKEFFPNAQLFGFTGTPIFEQNATVKQIDGDVQTLKTTEDVFQQELHAYTITHAIDDRNVLRFHVDYFKPDGEKTTTPEARRARSTKRAVVDAILDKHDAATAGRRFNALLATASSINDAIAYYELFETSPGSRGRPTTRTSARSRSPAVFSPPAEGNADVRQLQEDLPQEKADNAARAGQEESRTQADHRRLQRQLRHQPLDQRVRRLLPGRAAAHQGPAAPERRPAAAKAPRRSTSPSSWTCCSPASTPSTSTPSTSTRTSSTTA